MRWSPRECPFNTWFMSRQHGALLLTPLTSQSIEPITARTSLVRRLYDFFILFFIRLHRSARDYEIKGAVVRSHVSGGSIDRVFGSVLCRFVLIGDFLSAVHRSLSACGCPPTCPNDGRSLHQAGIFLRFVKSVASIVGCLRFCPSVVFKQNICQRAGRTSVFLKGMSMGHKERLC